MRKVSISLEDGLWERASGLAQHIAGGNLSLLASVALRRVLTMPTPELSKLISLQRLDREAPTRQFWMEAFWDVLADAMGRPEMKGAYDSVYAPRHFGDFFAVLLLNHVGRYDDEDDPFVPHIGPMPVMPASPPPVQWTFSRSTSPVAAAETVATKLQEYGVVVPTQ